MDVRMSIGLGEMTYKAKKISESNGPAFLRSGEVFETLKKQKINLAINSGNAAFDNEINLMLQLCLTFMDNWLTGSLYLFPFKAKVRWDDEAVLDLNYRRTKYCEDLVYFKAGYSSASLKESGEISPLSLSAAL